MQRDAVRTILRGDGIARTCRKSALARRLPARVATRTSRYHRSRLMKIALPTFAAFRAFALLACGLELAVRMVDALSSTPAMLVRQAGAWQWPQWVAVTVAPGNAAPLNVGLVLVSFGAFAWAFWRRTSRPAASRWDAALLLAQVAVGALVESDLLYLVAAEFAFLMPHRQVWRWLAILGVGTVAANLPEFMHVHGASPRCNVPGLTPPSADVLAWLDWSLELAFQAFAYAVGRFAASEWQGRQALAAATAELAGANEQLDRAVRLAEQERIAGRVHQALERHGPTLLAHLELAKAQASGCAAQSVGVAHEQAVCLSDNVRQTVTTQALQRDLDLRGALATLCDGVPSLKVSLTWDPPSPPIAPPTAHTVFRLVQEALTNCIRHACATTLQICVTGDGEALKLLISDDGRGDAEPEGGARAGQGLRGMRERIEAHGGRFEAGTRGGGGGGFVISARLPLSPATPS